MVSVIVPAYNSAKTITECLEAICNSTYQNLEVIVVDDGSEDETPKLLEAWSQKDARIKVVRIENSGPGHARNVGMEHMTGEYFLFADSDDRIEPHAIEELKKIAEEKKADIVCGSYNRMEKNQKHVVALPVSEGYISPRNTKEEEKRYHKLKTSSTFGYLWNKLHRTSFFREHKLKMPDQKEINLEDNLFYLQALSKEPVFYIADIVVSNYNVMTGSLTRRYDSSYAEKSRETLRYIWNYFEEEQTPETYMDVLAPLAMRLYVFSLVKNMTYEKLTMEKMVLCTKEFMEEESFRHILTSEKCIPSLKTIQDIFQRIFYCICVRALRKGKEKRYLRILWLGQPLLRCYLGLVLR